MDKLVARTDITHENLASEQDESKRQTSPQLLAAEGEIGQPKRPT